MAQVQRQTTRSRRRGNHSPSRTQTDQVELGIQDQAHVVGVLNRVLSDENVLYIKTKGYHWNVEGPSFYAMHKLLQEHYETLDAVIDEAAERVRALGGRPFGSFASFLDHARIQESNGRTTDAGEIVGELVADHEAIIRHLRGDITTCEEAGDDGTRDLLTGYMRTHEKMAWMLRSLRASE